tara:strand:+ start:1043 stop:1654 length:612 start_codon:yes stop_codon:yes gene_type:complete
MAMSKLEAINLMLDSIGEAPVSSLESGLADAETAERIFNQVDADVQSVGWHCNRERERKLIRDESNQFPIPSTTLTVDTTKNHKWVNVTVRGAYLYDIKNQSLTWTSTTDNDHDHLYVDIVQQQEFEDLPYSLQRYIAARAAREFQESVLSSATLDSFTIRKEAEMYAALLQDEAEKEDANVLYDNNYSYKISRRRNNRLYGM